MLTVSGFDWARRLSCESSIGDGGDLESLVSGAAGISANSDSRYRLDKSKMLAAMRCSFIAVFAKTGQMSGVCKYATRANIALFTSFEAFERVHMHP